MSKLYPDSILKSKIVLFVLGLLLLQGGVVWGQSPEIFTSNGTFTVPAGVTSITVEAWGGGGGGATRTTSGRGGGGGGGAYARSIINGVATGTQYNIVVGNGGAANSAGGNSTFGGTIVRAAEGSGAAQNTNGGASGGTVANSIGDVRYRGGNGAAETNSGGWFPTYYSGGGGGGAGSTANGNDANGVNGGVARATNGGNGGNGRSNQGNGVSGQIYGGGGSGALRSFSGTRTGGSGAPGLVIITYTVNPSPTIAGFTPASACLGETPTITITGTNFSGATAVRINGVNAASFAIVNATTITAVLPASGVSTGPITVVSPNGTGTSSSNFTINIPPSITGQSTASQPRCVGVAANAFTVNATGTTLTYQWYSNSTPINTGGTTMGTTNGARTATFTPPTNTAGTLYYYVVVSGTCAPSATSNVSGAIIVNPLPVAGAITGNASICPGASTTLTPNPTGTGPFTYTWASSNTAVATVTNAGVVTGVSAGTSNITYTVSDGNSCVATSANFAFTVSPSAGAITSAGNATGACAGNTVNMTPHATGVGPFTYTWNSSNPSVASVSATGVVTALSLGTTNITYTVTDANSCTATSANFAFGVTEPVANNITGATEVCAGSTIPLTPNATGAGTLTYSWSSSNTTVATVSGSGVVSGVSAGTTNITYIVTDGNGCTATSPAYTITVNPRPLTATGATGGATCGNGTVTLSVDDPGAGFTIDWYSAATNGTLLASGTNTYTTPSITGTTNYYAQVRNTSTGCVSATRLAVTATFNALPGTPGTGSGAATCGPGSVTISAPSGAGLTIDWYDAATGGSLLLSNSNNYTTPVISGTTTYYAAARNATTGCVSAARRAVVATVNIVPNPPAGTDNARCGSGAITISASLSGALIDWYAAPTGGSVLSTGNSYGPNLSATTTFYAQSRINATGCISATRTAVTATINEIPPIATGAVGASRCGTGSVTISVDDPGAGLAVDWYSASTNGTLLQSNSNSYTTGNLTGTTSYWAQVRNTTTGCTSPTRLQVTATVTAIPSTPGTGGGNSICGPGTVTISASSPGGITVDWYDASTGGELLASGSNSFITPVISTTTTYYAEARNSTTGCISTSRRAVTATIYTVPPIPVPTSSNGTLDGGIYSRCESIIISASGGSGYTVYFQGTDPNGTSTAQGAGNRTITTSGTYYYRSRTTSNCWSDAVPITVVVHPLPAAPSVTGAGEFCGSTVITASGGGGGTIYFQGKTSQGTSTAEPATSQTVTSSGTYYFRSLSAEGCWGPQGSVVVSILALPTGNFTASETSGLANNDNIICAGATVTFTAPSGYPFYTFKNGTTTLLASTNRVFNTSSLISDASVTVEVLGGNGCTATLGPIPITVTPLPTPTLTANSSTTICVGESITFTAGGGTNYDFKVNGSTVQNGASATYTSTIWTNNDKVTVEVSNANECAATSSEITVTVNELPTGTFTASSTEICVGQNITFTATGGIEYQFSVGGTVIQTFSTVNTFSNSTLANGDVVTVEVKNAAGCIGTFPAYPAIPVTINPLPTGSVTVTENSGGVNDFSICANAPVTYTFPTGYQNYNFLVNGESKQSSNANTFIYSALETGDEVTVLVRTNSSCETTFTAPSVTIAPSPAGTLSASDLTICAGEEVTFIATPDASNTSYNFKINNVQAAIGSSNVFTTSALNDGDVVTVEVTNSNGCITIFNAITMAVTALPTGTMNITETSGNTNDDATICAGAEVTFTAPGGFTNYNFLLNGVSVQDGASSVYTTSTLANNNTVTVAVTNAGGCIALLNEFTMTVDPLPVVAAITGPVVVCVDGDITLSNATTGGTWSSSDETIATVDPATGVVTGVADGAVQIYYTITSTTTNCSNTAEHTITVNALPTVAPITGNFDVCVGNTTALSSTTPGGSWSSSDENIATVDAAGIVTGIADGIVTISYAVTNSNNCINTVTVDVNVHALPVVPAIAGILDVCINATTPLTNATTGGAWTTSDPNIATVNGLTGVVTGIAAGSVTIYYTVTDGNDCVTQVNAEVVVNALPVPTLTGPNPICLGSVGNVYTTESGQSQYTWNIVNGVVTDGGTPTDSTVTISWLNSGIKSISVNYEDANGCAGATVATVENAPGSSPVISGPTEVCLNSEIVYTTQHDKIDYNWTVSGGDIVAGGFETDSTVTIRWHTTGNRSLTVNYADIGGCSAATPTVYPVVVRPLPTATITGNAIVCEGTAARTITFRGAGSVAPYTFTYQINGDPDQTVTTTSGNAVNVTHTTDIPGTFTYTLISVQGSGNTNCSQVQDGSVTITVTPIPVAEITYPSSPVCKNSGLIQVTRTGTEGGTYLSGSGLSINTATGEIDPLSSTPGTYVVTYRIVAAGGCATYNFTTSVTITNPPSATINYDGGPFCTTATPKNVTRTGTSGGTYSSTAGLTIDPASGAITPGTSTPGTHTVTYTIAAAGGCDEYTTTTEVTITAAPSATISYGGSPYCTSAGTATVTFSGTPGGTYSAPAGLSIDAGTGAINLAGSTGGNYTVTYSVPASGGCAAISTTASVTINAAPVANAGSVDAATCANSGPTNITTGSSAANYSTVLWTSSGSGNFTNANSLTLATYNPSAADITAGSVILTLTATGNAGCGTAVSTKTLTISAVPAAFLIEPASATLCEGDVQALSASGGASGAGSMTFNSSGGNNNKAIPNPGNTTSTINIPGLPAGATITSVDVRFNISHEYTGELVLNLKAPNGNILNLVNQKGGGSGAGFNTTIRSTSTTNINGNAPFNGVYRADRVMNVGAPQISNVNTFNQLLGTMAGNWVLSAQDIVGCRGSIFGWCYGGDYEGRINSWSIVVNYNLPVNPISVTWSPVTDLYTDIETTIPYTGQDLSTVYAMPSPGTVTYTATQTNSSGCSTAKTVNLVTTSTPVVKITADYCIVPGFVRLTASSTPAATGFLWSNGATTSVIEVDESGIYEVQAFVSGSSCPGDASIGVSTELVINGDFEQGDVNFVTDYRPRTGVYYTGAGTTGLYPEGDYAVDKSAFSPSNGSGYHRDFHGRDHTSGSGNFLMVNGSRDIIKIWEQTVNVLPNTDYYFSAWAMNLNPGSPARLRFEVNGVQVGTIAELNNAPKPTTEAQVGISNWVRFYSDPTWKSGPTTTTAVIRIINLNTAEGGNDFGLDDISFGTLSTFIQLVSAPGTDAQVLCKNTAIENILYNVGNGSAGGPAVTGLPAGVTDVFDGDRLTISGTPTVAGNYTYTITTTGCGATTATGTITVEEQKIVLSAGNTAPVCKDAAMPARVYTLSGTATGATVSTLPDGVTGTLSGNTFTISGTPTVSAGVYNYTITTEGDCEVATIGGSITVQEQTIALSSPVATAEQTVCINTPITNIRYNVGGTGTGASFDGLPTGVTGGYFAGIVTISGTPSVAGTFNYTVTTTGPCGSVFASGTIDVTPAASLTLTSAAGTDAQTVCNNTNITPIIYTVNDATSASITGGNLPAGITGTFNAGVFTISGSAALRGTHNYTITTTGGCATATASGTLTVNAQGIALSSGTSSPSVCANAPMTDIVFALSGDATGAALSGQPEGITGSLSANLFTVSGIPTDAPGTYNYTITTSGPTTCSPATFSGVITVLPTAIPGTISTPALTCSGGSGSVTVVGSVGTITWQISTDGGTTWNNTTPVNHTITQNYTNLTSPVQYRAQVGNNCGNLYSNVAVIGIHNLWTGAIDTDWNNPGNWSDNQLPSLACPNVYIPNTTNKPELSSGTGTIRNIFIDAGAELTVNGTGILEIAGTISNSGIFDVSEGTVHFNGTVAQTIGVSTFTNHAIKDLKVVNSNSLSLAAPLDVYGSVTFGGTNGNFVTNHNLTLKSNINNTAWLGNMTGGHKLSGEVTVERFINTGVGGTTGAHRKSWQLLAVPTNGGQTINQAWQDTATFPNQVRYPGYGTMIVSNAGGNQANATALGFDQYTAPGPSIKVWNSTTGGYDGPPSTVSTPIYNLKGYMVMVRGDRTVITSTSAAIPTTLRSKGKLFTPADPPASASVAAGLSESVGNPYASAIDLRELITSPNLVETFIVWDPRATGAYGLGSFTYLTKQGTDFYATPPTVSYPGTGTPYNYIESGQAFLIQATTSGSATVGFTENAKVSGSNPQLLRGQGEAGRQSHLRTNLYVGTDTNMTLADGTLIQYDASYSNELDIKDARKLTNTSENLGMRSNDKLLAVERRAPIVETDTVFFNISGMRVQPYKFEFIASGLTEHGMEGWLEDNYTETKTPLNMEGKTEYSFTIENKLGSYAADRFRIVFKPAAGPLPVTFLALNAQQNGDDIQVGWKVENETATKAYEVEKSIDGVRFVRTASVIALNNGAGSYDWLDKDVNPGWNYYRIRSVDQDGKVSYSDVVKVLVEKIAPQITVYPNPIVNGVINVHLINQPAGNYKLRLLNSLGQTMVTRQITRQKGTSIEPLTWDYKLARGNYHIEVTQPDGGVKLILVVY